MLARDLKKVVAMAKLVACYPVDNPCLVYDRGTFQAWNLRNVAFEYTAGKDELSTSFDLGGLARVLKKIKSEEEVTLKEGMISTAKTTYNIPEGAPLEEIPEPFKPVDLKVSARLDFPWRDVEPMMEKDEGREHLHGILLEANKDGFWMVATDGHRIAYRRCDGRLMDPIETHGSFLVPGAAVPCLMKLSSFMPFAWGDDGAVFLDGPWLIYCKAPLVKFPPWEEVIPKPSGRWSATFDRQALLATLDRVDVGVDDLRLEVNGGAVAFIAEDLDGEDPLSAMEVLRCDVTGDPIRIGVSLAYLKDAIIHTASDPITITSEGPNSAMRVGEDNAVMPKRLS